MTIFFYNSRDGGRLLGIPSQLSMDALRGTEKFDHHEGFIRILVTEWRQYRTLTGWESLPAPVEVEIPTDAISAIIHD